MRSQPVTQSTAKLPTQLLSRFASGLGLTLACSGYVALDLAEIQHCRWNGIRLSDWQRKGPVSFQDKRTSSVWPSYNSCLVCTDQRLLGQALCSAPLCKLVVSMQDGQSTGRMIVMFHDCCIIPLLVSGAT